jgi:glyoxylase-like metal-dependent hydrolase (beta-lactamase superfamily II)
MQNNAHAQAKYQNVTTTVKLKGKEVKVHGLCVGSVAVKANFKTKYGPGPLSKLNILLGSQYTEYLPIWVWVIEHPEGLIVVDTGENAQSKDVDKYLAKESFFMRYQMKHACRVKMDIQDELNHQLNNVNLKVDDVKLVVLTHLHLDHIDGLKFFPRQEIIVGNHEFTHPENVFKSIFPSWLKPNKVEYSKNKIEVFNQAYALTRAEDLLYIPTPGHTLGHSSLVFRTDDFDIIFSGDSSYDQLQVLTGEMAGANSDYSLTKQTYANLLKYAHIRKTIYLPTHDDEAGKRLMQKRYLVE